MGLLFFTSLFQTTYLPMLSAVIAIGGLLFAVWKVRPEADGLAAQASKTAVEVFNASVGNLEKQLVEARKEIGGLEERLKRMENEYVGRIELIRRQRDIAAGEARAFANQVITAERENHELKLKLDKYARIHPDRE